MWVGIEFPDSWGLEPEGTLARFAVCSGVHTRVVQRKSVAQIAEGESGNLILYYVFHRSQYNSRKRRVM